MAFELTGRRAAALAAILVVSAGLSACTTTEGTNAFTSFQTFDSEVMEPTAQGLGLVPKSVKPDPTNNRGPLVLPKDTTNLPPPQTDTQEVADLPKDADQPDINTAGLSNDDIEKLRHVRVVDVNTPDGRPLSAAELQKLVGKMKSYQLSQKRSIFVPPESYFQIGADTGSLVCLSGAGDLVSVDDPSCPASIRAALLKKKT